MQPSEQPRDSADKLLHGVQSGVIAGLVMLCVLALFAIFDGQPWWRSLNILGSTFYGARSARWPLGWITLAGAAMQTIVSGVVGAAFSLVPGGIRRTNVLIGIAIGLAWRYLGDATLWRWVNPWVPYYFSGPAYLTAYGLFGACLGLMHPQTASTSASHDSAAPPPLPSEPSAPPEDLDASATDQTTSQ